jgi:hypothetical protein
MLLMQGFPLLVRLMLAQRRNSRTTSFLFSGWGGVAPSEVEGPGP